MAIDLTYGDNADQYDLDAVLVATLGRKIGYVVELQHYAGTTALTRDYVVVSAPRDGAWLTVRRFDVDADSAVGDPLRIQTPDITAIKIH